MHSLRKRKICAHAYISACPSHPEYASLPATYGSVAAPLCSAPLSSPRLPSPLLSPIFCHFYVAAGISRGLFKLTLS